MKYTNDICSFALLMFVIYCTVYSVKKGRVVIDL